MTAGTSSDQERSRFITGVVISVTGALCFSTKAVFVKLGYRDGGADPLSLLALRMLFSLPLFAAAAAVAWWRKPQRLPLTYWMAVAATGVLGYHISSLLDFAGLRHISAGLERLVLFTYPTIVLLLSAGLFHQQILPRQWLAVAISYAGIALAFVGEYASIDRTGTGHLIEGVLLVFACAITYGSYIVASSRLIRNTGPALFNSVSMLAACFGVLLHQVLAGSASLVELPAAAWQYGFLMAVFSTVIPSYLIAESMRRIGGDNTAIIASIGPVSTIFMASWLLDEPVTAMQLLGTAAILAGIWLVARREQPQGK